MELGIDVEAIQKGDVISDATIRRVVGETDDPVEFIKLRHFWAENLKAALRRAGKLFTLRWVTDELHVLVDEAASKENAKWFDNYRRRMRVRNELLLAVDTTALSREQKAKHERAVLKQGAVLTAMGRAVRELPRVVATRATPAVRMPPREQRRVI